MKKGAVGFMFLVTLLFLVVVGYRYYQYMVLEDFTIELTTACNPSLEQCFIADTDEPDFSFQLEPYKKVDITARYAPPCLEEHTCTDFSCVGVPSGCEITYCDSSTVSEGEKCLDPNQE